MKAGDWLVRTLLLILSGMATLAVIGSIAAIPSGGFPGGMGTLLPDDVVVVAGASGGGQASEPPADAWAESIAYALIALAGIAAAMLIVLMRIAGHLGEIARRDRF